MSETPQESVRPEYVRRLFDRIAPYYDPMNWLISLGMHGWWKRLTLDRADVLEEGGRLLDLCCGSGDFVVMGARRVNGGGRVVGVDFSSEMLEVARDRVATLASRAEISLVNDDVTDLGRFEDASFNLVTIGFGLRNLDDKEACIADSLRVLRPGGAFAVLDLSKPVAWWMRPVYWVYLHLIVPLIALVFTGSREEYEWLAESLKHHPSRSELAEMLSEAGFASVETYPLAGGVAAIHIGHKGAGEDAG